MSSRFFARWTGVAVVSFLSASVFAQEDAVKSFPNKPIRIIVGYVAGGGNDIIARVVSAKMGEGLGQPVIIENKPGAQSIIAAEFVAKSAPDGHTVLMGPSGPMSMNPATYSKLPYNPVRDFVPVSMIGSFPLILVVDPALPVRSVKELVDYAKARPNNVNYGASAAPFQLAAELLNQKTGTKFAYIPYKGSNESANAVVAGQLTITISDPPPVTGLLKGGRVRGLAVTSAARHPGWPELPTMVESGLDIEVVIWTGFFVPAATPMPIVRRLQEEVARVVKLPEIRERLAAMGVEASGITSEEFGRILAADIAKWTAVAKAANIKAD
jgi:tripartite-type tricarboxylate transporter receptor subunit TctC